MSLELRSIPYKDKKEVRKFLDTYLIELITYGEFDIRYPRFDHYWEKDNHWPYWITLNNQKIGFIFVDQISRFVHELDYFLAEFFIMPQYRAKGLGQAAFREIIALYKGQWELSFFIKNKPAELFWGKVTKQLDAQKEKHKELVILRFNNNQINCT